MNGKRNQLEIIANVLRVALGEKSVTKTKIVYGANLNFDRAKRYLDMLEKMGLVGIRKASGKKLYFTTEKGKSFLADYEKVEKG